MFRRNGLLSLIAVVATFLAFASTASAGMRGLTTTIEAQKSFLGAADDAVVRITYRNDSAEDLYLVRWQTALQGVEENLFDVRLDGQPVAYTGRLYKRATPGATDYVRIPAGGSVSADVELSSVYDMSRTGEYAIRYHVARSRTACAPTPPRSPDSEPRSLDSNVVFLGRRAQRAGDRRDREAGPDRRGRPSRQGPHAELRELLLQPPEPAGDGPQQRPGPGPAVARLSERRRHRLPLHRPQLQDLVRHLHLDATGRA